MRDSFGARSSLRVSGRDFDIFRLDACEKHGFNVQRLPYSLKVLLENLLRSEDGVSVDADDIKALAGWRPGEASAREIAFMPARVLLQDFTGVPALVDLAAMRDAMAELGGDPKKVNPLLPVELVIDHSVQVDVYAAANAFEKNRAFDYHRNHERYAFLRWGQRSFDNFKVVPPLTGIVHQVNLEHLARVVFTSDENPAAPQGSRPVAYPDTLVGTDSHTPMVNGLGVLGWGVGGIEAEAAMLGQPIAMLIPEVLGVRVSGELREGATATDLVLHVAEMLRKVGVVGKLVEFYGPGVASLGVSDRATISNMTPEYGATATMFPIDDETLRYLRFTGRDEERVKLVEAYSKEQGLFYTKDSPEPEFSKTIELDLSTVEPSLAGPKRPQDRISLSKSATAFKSALPSLKPSGSKPKAPQGENIGDGSVVIAAITSCTNTSNPSVMLAAGLLAKKAVEKGLEVKPWVKTSLAPGSQVVMRYYEAAGLIEPLEKLGFHLVGYGCTTCIGNSGPLRPDISKAIEDGKLVAASVLSGNRNFEGRIHPEVRANYLMSPPLVVAFALAGRVDLDLTKEPLGTGKDGKPVYLRDLWPTSMEIEDAIRSSLRPEMFEEVYRDIYEGDEEWKALPVPEGDRYAWADNSTYVRHPPYFEGMEKTPPSSVEDLKGVRALALLGDSVTTDHISPAGAIRRDSPAGQYLEGKGVKLSDFNSYGSRRGNHEVMVRGTFANVRLKNELAPGTEGNATTYLPTGEVMTLFEASTRYLKDGTPLCVIAGKEYGSGSSRDWAAKGPALMGVRFVIAESYERIHRSNLIGMGILPLQFERDQGAKTHGLSGRETFSVEGLKELFEGDYQAGRTVKVHAKGEDGAERVFDAIVRIDTPMEAEVYRHGGILQLVLRQLLRDGRPGVVSSVHHADGHDVHASDSNGASVDDESKDSFPASDPPAR